MAYLKCMFCDSFTHICLPFLNLYWTTGLECKDKAAGLEARPCESAAVASLPTKSERSQ